VLGHAGRMPPAPTASLPAPPRAVPSVLVAALVARLPHVMVSLSLVLLVRDLGHAYVVAGAVTAAFVAGMAGAAPLLGRLADRIGAVPVLAGSAATSGAALALAAAVPGRLGPPGLAAAALVAGAATPPVSAVLRALLPRIAREGGLRTLYALEAALQEALFISGPLIVVGVVAVASPRAALGACALLLLAGTAGFALATRGRATPAPPGRRAWALRPPALRRVAACYALVGVVFGAVELATIAALDEAGNRGLAGVVLAAWATGSLTGGLVVARRVRGDAATRLAPLLACLLVLALPLAPLAGAPPLLAAALVLHGVVIAPTLGTIYELVSRVSAADVLTEAFAWTTSAVFAGVALGNALAGVLVGWGGPAAGYGPAVAAPALAVLLARGLRAEVASSTATTTPSRRTAQTLPSGATATSTSPGTETPSQRT